MRLLLAVVALSLIGRSPALSQDEDTSKAMISMLEAFGFKQINRIDQSSCRILIDADQAKIIDSVPLLQKMDVLNSDMTKTELMKAPTKTTLAVALQMAPIEIKALYDGSTSADKCFFQHNLIYNDEYGNSKKEVMFTYSFDRQLYRKINWDNFKSQNLIKVAKDFKPNPTVFSRIGEE